ncbi:TPA: hypothetical protein DIV48_00295 [Candidatus Kaiserbacteria bacterium]|nr:hypothetical protein [Candidatus Kaiserbacteria bacterium]
MSGILTLLAFVSTIFFPWSFTAALAIAVALFEPLVPLAVGLFADTLYYVPHAGTLPVFTLYGAVATMLAFFVRNRLNASIIGR